jgi:hypothetical protein
VGLDIGVAFPAARDGLRMAAMEAGADLLPTDGDEHLSLVIQDGAGYPKQLKLGLQQLLQLTDLNQLAENRFNHDPPKATANKRRGSTSFGPCRYQAETARSGFWVSSVSNVAYRFILSENVVINTEGVPLPP